MAQLEPGFYKSSDDIRVFDGGEDSQLEDEGSRLPLLIVIALLVFFAFGGVVWLAYNQGVKHGRDDVPRTIIAEHNTAKAARSASKAETRYKGLEIYQPPSRSGEERASKGEAGQASQQASQDMVPPTVSAVLKSPVKTALLGKKQMSETPVAAAPIIATTNRKVTLHQMLPPEGRTHVGVNAPPATRAPSRIVQKPLPSQSKPPADETRIAAAPAATAAMPPKIASVSAGGLVLQIGSYKSEAEAMDSWRAYKASHAAAADFEPDIKQAELPGKGTWFRLRIGSFASAAAANSLCAKLKASGGACFPAKP